MLKKILLAISIILSISIVLAMVNSLYLKANKLRSRGSEKKEIEKLNKNPGLFQPKVGSWTKKDGIDVTAKSVILIDTKTGKAIYEKNSQEKLSPASITKIMTLCVALENHSQNDWIKISENAAGQVANKLGLRAGDELRLDDLLYGLMMVSANDAAYAISESVDGGTTSFVKEMNDKVKALGLKNTSFTNPAGFDEDDNHSSAYDMATIAQYALRTYPKFKSYAGQKEDYSVYQTDRNTSYWWGNISSLLYSYPGMVAVKNGYTEKAKSTFVGLAEKNDKSILVVYMGSTSPKEDGKKILDYGFSQSY